LLSVLTVSASAMRIYFRDVDNNTVTRDVEVAYLRSKEAHEALGVADMQIAVGKGLVTGEQRIAIRQAAR